MRQRPVACAAFLLFLILLLMPAEFFYRTPRLTEKCKAEVLGYEERRTWKNEKMQLLLEDCQIRTGEDEFQEDRLLVYTKDPTEYEVGSILSLSGTIYPIEEPTNPGQFNSRLYYAGKGISYTLYADHVNHMGGTVHPVKEQLLRLQKQIGQIYETVLEEPEDGILKAMVLGDKTELDSEVQKLYQQNGISHVLAISGLHISLIGMGLYKMLKRITGYGMISAIPTMALLMAYGWMTGGSLSSVRAVGMCAIAILADLVGRTYDMLTAMGVMLLVIARTNPLAVKQSAFLLSFGAVLGIAWFGPLWTLEEKKKKKEKKKLPLIIRFQRFVSRKLFAKISKKFKSIADLGDSLDTLASINENVDELIAMKVPYGETNANYEKLTNYLYRANRIHAEIAKKMHRM